MISILYALVILFEVQSLSCSRLSLDISEDSAEADESRRVLENYFVPKNGTSSLEDSPKVIFRNSSLFPTVPFATIRYPRCKYSHNTESFVKTFRNPPAPSPFAPAPAPAPKSSTISSRQLEMLKDACVQAILDDDNWTLTDIVDTMTAKRPDLNFSSMLFDDEDSASTLLHLCIKHDKIDAFSELLRSDVDPNLTDSFGRDVIQYACEERKLSFLQELLAYNPIVEAKHILLAVETGYPQLLLCFHRAGIDIKRICGKRAINLALSRGKMQMVKILAKLGC